MKVSKVIILPRFKDLKVSIVAKFEDLKVSIVARFEDLKVSIAPRFEDLNKEKNESRSLWRRLQGQRFPWKESRSNQLPLFVSSESRKSENLYKMLLI